MSITVTAERDVTFDRKFRTKEDLLAGTATALQPLSLTTDMSIVGMSAATGVNNFGLAATGIADGTEKMVFAAADGEATVHVAGGTATSFRFTQEHDFLDLKYMADKWRVLALGGSLAPSGGGGTTTFTGLTDTPSSITANEFLKGNAAGSALEFGYPAWTSLSDTPASITADGVVVGNGGGTALTFGGPLSNYLTTTAAQANYLERDGGNTITGTITGDANNTRSFGSESVRFDKMWGRMGIFLGGDGVIDASFQGGAQGPKHGGIIAGSQNLVGTMVHNMDSANVNFPAVALIGNTYNQYTGSTCTFRNTGGGAVQFGSAYTTYDTLTSRVSTTAFGAFTQVYAWAYGGNSLADNEAPGAVLLGYPATNVNGVVSKARNFNTAAGCFTLARTPYSAAGSGESRAYNRGGGSMLISYINNGGSGTCLAQVNSGSRGSIVAGYLRATGANAAQLRTGNNDVGAFATGAVAATSELARIEASSDGGMASGYALNAIISITGTGARGGGFAQASNDITVSGQGGFGWGNSLNGAISATASNAVQFGVGVNAAADSLQVGQTAALGTGLHFHSGGPPAVPVNGDMWVTAAGAVTIQSGGVACVCTNAVM